jgi:hypothetical protein
MPDLASPPPQAATRFRPVPFNSSRPSPARVWETLLSEEYACQPDRLVAAMLTRDCSLSVALARTHRAHHQAMVALAVTTYGIDRFADLGSGYARRAPESGHSNLTRNTHQIATDAAANGATAATRVLYVDHEQSVTPYLAATADRKTTHYLAADYRDTSRVLDMCARWLGDAPRAYLLTAAAEWVEDHELTEVVRGLVNGSPSNSLICLVHTDERPETLHFATCWWSCLPGSTFAPRSPERLARLVAAGGAVVQSHHPTEQLRLPEGTVPAPVYGMVATI